ncbi:hypothetical protein [Escherichia phage FXie-2024a]
MQEYWVIADTAITCEIGTNTVTKLTCQIGRRLYLRGD